MKRLVLAVAIAAVTTPLQAGWGGNTWTSGGFEGTQRNFDPFDGGLTIQGVQLDEKCSTSFHNTGQTMLYIDVKGVTSSPVRVAPQTTVTYSAPCVVAYSGQPRGPIPGSKVFPYQDGVTVDLGGKPVKVTWGPAYTVWGAIASKGQMEINNGSQDEWLDIDGSHALVFSTPIGLESEAPSLIDDLQLLARDPTRGLELWNFGVKTTRTLAYGLSVEVAGEVEATVATGGVVNWPAIPVRARVARRFIEGWWTMQKDVATKTVVAGKTDLPGAEISLDGGKTWVSGAKFKGELGGESAALLVRGSITTPGVESRTLSLAFSID